jgi:hypothetical protein
VAEYGHVYGIKTIYAASSEVSIDLQVAKHMNRIKQMKSQSPLPNSEEGKDTI